MVNYRYELNEIEANHEAYANEGTVVASRAVRSLLRREVKGRGAAEVKRIGHSTKKRVTAAVAGEGD